MVQRQRSKSKNIEYSDLHVSVEDYDAEVRAGINYHAHSPHLAWNLDDRDPMYDFGCSITVVGKLIYPKLPTGD